MANIVNKSLSAIDERIRALERELEGLSDSSDHEDAAASGAGSSHWEGSSAAAVFAAAKVDAAATDHARKKAAKKAARREEGLADVARADARKKAKKLDGSGECDVAGSTSAGAEVLSLRCECCNVQVNSQALMREHLQGRKHVQVARVHAARAEARYCEACELVFTSPAQLVEHCKGKRHKEAARQKGRDRG